MMIIYKTATYLRGQNRNEQSSVGISQELCHFGQCSSSKTSRANPVLIRKEYGKKSQFPKCSIILMRHKFAGGGSIFITVTQSSYNKSC